MITSIYYKFEVINDMNNNENEHPSYYNSKGEEIPSVTQIISLLNHKGFMEWSNMLGFKKIKVEEYLDECAWVGTVVHNRISLTFEGKTDFLDIGGQKGMQIDMLYKRFLAWKESAKVEMIMSEERMQNERYGGTLDLICKYPNGCIGLIDFKTGAKVKPSHLLQLGGYLNLLESNYPELYEKISFAEVISLGGKSIQLVSRSIEDMQLYRDTFEKIYLLRCSWMSVLNDNWNETIIK
jgi:hypothetical protein